VTTSRSVARKLWGFFAYPNPSAPLVESLATNWRANGLEVRALLRDIFTRPEFYTPQAKRGLLRSPVELVVAALRSTGVSVHDATPWDLDGMGQRPFYPPNVSGWRQNSYWLSTAGAWARADYYDGPIAWRAYNTTPKFLSWTGWDPTSRTYLMTSDQAVDAAFSACGVTDPSPTTRARLVTWLDAQRAVPANVAWRDLQFINLGKLVMLSPDFQLA
jgi:uncharacterized protein (DUF1800 family)